MTDSRIIILSGFKEAFTLQSSMDGSDSRRWSSHNPRPAITGTSTPSSLLRDCPESDNGLHPLGSVDRIFPIKSAIKIQPVASASSPSRDGTSAFSTAGRASSTKSAPRSTSGAWGKVEQPQFMTARFRHQMTEEGHMVVTGIDGAEQVTRCEVGKPSQATSSSSIYNS